jgi:acetolactate decarboxylase
MIAKLHKVEAAFLGFIVGSAYFFSAVVPADSRARLIVVHDRGSMQDVFVDGAAPKVFLSEIETEKHLYALGPLSKLRGELMILDSVPWEARVRNGKVQVKSDWKESAAFLVWASVAKWQKTRVPLSVVNLHSFESWLQSLSGKPGSPLQFQYPFRVKGTFGRINWHIVNVRDDGTPLSEEKHRAQTYHGESRDVDAEFLGFYSPQHQGIFINPGRRTHIHMKVGNERATSAYTLRSQSLIKY